MNLCTRKHAQSAKYDLDTLETFSIGKLEVIRSDNIGLDMILIDMLMPKK